MQRSRQRHANGGIGALTPILRFEVVIAPPNLHAPLQFSARRTLVETLQRHLERPTGQRSMTIPMMTFGHEMTAAQTMQRNEGAAARTLSLADFDRFLPLVRRTAMRLARRVPREITVADLVGYGWIGLIEAFRRAQPGMPENEFEAYALYRVKGAMLDHLRDLDPASRSTRKASRLIARAIADLFQTLGRAPEEEEIASVLGMTEDQYRQALTDVAAAGMARLEMVQLDNMEAEITYDDTSEGRRLLSSALVRAIGTLPARLQQVLALYYQEDCTLREIGDVLGVTESRVSQLHTEAVHRLRAAIGRE